MFTENKDLGRGLNIYYDMNSLEQLVERIELGLRDSVSSSYEVEDIIDCLQYSDLPGEIYSSLSLIGSIRNSHHLRSTIDIVIAIIINCLQDDVGLDEDDDEEFFYAIKQVVRDNVTATLDINNLRNKNEF